MTYANQRPTAVFDIECYRNYFLVMFQDVASQRGKVFEFYEGHPLDVEGIQHLLRRWRVVSFNGNSYDIPMLSFALAGASNIELKRASDGIILADVKPWEFYDLHEIGPPRGLDHIDLIEVAPGKGGLKQYGGRLHSRRIQDLPIEPDATITPGQREQLVGACFTGGRRGQQDQRQAGCIEGLLGFTGFFRRQVDQQHTIHTGLHGRLGEGGVAVDLHRVQVAHQYYRRLRVTLSELRHGLQHVAAARPACQCTFGAALDGRAIGHRVGERHAQFDHIGAGIDQCMHDRHGGLQRGITGSDEGNQRLALLLAQSLETGIESGYRHLRHILQSVQSHRWSPSTSG